MIDSAEKVRIIEALKNCLDRPKCRDCPWHECEDVFDDGCVIPRSLAEKALALVEELMTVERKRGRWEGLSKRLSTYFYRCSVCGRVTEESTFAFCPSCGADMRERGETDA